MPYPLLILQVIDAKGLAAKDTVLEIKTTGKLSLDLPVETIQTSDPFAKALFLNKKGKVLHEDKTEVVPKNLNPIWGWNSVPFSGDQVPEPTKKKLAEELHSIRIEVWDRDATTNDFLGKVDIVIEDKEQVRLNDETYSLEPRSKSDKDIKGKIRIDLNYKTAALVEKEKKEAEEKARRDAAAKKEAEEKARIAAIIEHENKVKAEQAERQKQAGGESAMDNPINFMIRPNLAILLQRATDLKGKDTVSKKDPTTGKTIEIKTSDPYCWVRFYASDERLIYEEKTEVIKETTNPSWNFKIEPFENFAVSEEVKDKLQAELKNIQIQLYDYERILRDDFLGQVVIPLEGKEKVIMDDETIPLEGKKKGKDEKVQGTLTLTFTYRTSQQIEKEAKEAKDLVAKQKREAEEKVKREAEEKKKGKRESSVSPTPQKVEEFDKSGKKRVPWIPDHERNNCHVCGTGFSFFTRRHHCRACGEIMCGECGSKNATTLLLWCKRCNTTPPNTYAEP